MSRSLNLCLLVAFFCHSVFSPFAAAQEVKSGTMITETLNSTVLLDNRIGLNPDRNIRVYLPPDYKASGKRYPVVYYCHNTFSSAEALFDQYGIDTLLDRGFAHGVVGEFILVVADYTTPTTGSIYENSSVSGRWLDFTVQELVPFVDGHFRTLSHRDSRAVVGDFLGGRGALKLAMTHADIFGTVYALHPVATGMGHKPWSTLPIDWDKIHQAQSWTDLGEDFRTRLFVTISQGFLPNPNRPPFYCDFFMESENGKLQLHVNNIQKTKAGFHLEEALDESVDQLQSLRGLAFDWGRLDPIQDHVHANQAFTRQLEDLGIEHEAEEYRGDPWNQTWTDYGRFYTRVLPFLARHLVFAAQS